MTSMIVFLQTLWCWIVIYWHRQLTYEIKSEDVYEEFFKHRHLFDFINYPNNSKNFGEANKKCIGKMKDESEGKIIDESKMYSMKNSDGKESNTAKRVNIATKFNEFKDTLFNKKVLRRIQGKKHKIGTYEMNKIFLSVFDDKRFVLNNGIHTLAYFHKDLKNRFTQMIINKKRFKKILIKRKDSHKWLQMKTNACK